MNVDEYRERIARVLKRRDIAAAGTAAYDAAHCVLVLSEQCVSDLKTIEAIERLEHLAGIEVGEDGEYRIAECDHEFVESLIDDDWSEEVSWGQACSKCGKVRC